MKLRRATTGVVFGVTLVMGALGVVASPVRAEAASTAACGFYVEQYGGWHDKGWYNHCATNQVCIKVDLRYGFDYIKEVGPGHTFINYGVNNAYYVGLPHPTLRCRVFPV